MPACPCRMRLAPFFLNPRIQKEATCRSEQLMLQSSLGGVETYPDIHMAAVVNSDGTEFWSQSFSGMRAGYCVLLCWFRTYGVRMTRYCARPGVLGLEVIGPDRCLRRAEDDGRLEMISAAQAAYTGRAYVSVTTVNDHRRQRLLWSGEGRAKATVVFDTGSMVQRRLKARGRIRRDEIGGKEQAHQVLTAKTCGLRLKNLRNPTDTSQARLSELTHPTRTIPHDNLYQEACLEFLEYRRPPWVRCDLDTCVWWKTHPNLQAIRECAWMLGRQQNDLMNDFPLPIHNGPVEGLNNTAKVISQQAYGFCIARNNIRNLSHGIADRTFAQHRACMCVTNPERKGLVWKSGQSHRS